jgi:hypothetical protein
MSAGAIKKQEQTTLEGAGLLTCNWWKENRENPKEDV